MKNLFKNPGLSKHVLNTVFVSCSCRNTCLSVLPASDVCASFLLALNTWGKHIWECSQTTEGDQSMCVCERVCVHVWMTEMSLSVLGVSPKERVLHLKFVLASLNPNPDCALATTLSTPPFLHPLCVLWQCNNPRPFHIL